MKTDFTETKRKRNKNKNKKKNFNIPLRFVNQDRHSKDITSII